MTPPLRDPDYRRLDTKINALLAITGVTLLILILALVGIFDLAT